MSNRWALAGFITLGICGFLLSVFAITKSLVQQSADERLFQAVYNKDIPLARKALAHGANVNATWESDDYTPLAQAVGNDAVEMVQFLIANGARVELNGDSGQATLSKARGNMHSKVRSILEAALKDEKRLRKVDK